MIPNDYESPYYKIYLHLLDGGEVIYNPRDGHRSPLTLSAEHKSLENGLLDILKFSSHALQIVEGK